VKREDLAAWLDRRTAKPVSTPDPSAVAIARSIGDLPGASRYTQ
jgi:hypothetical protein